MGYLKTWKKPNNICIQTPPYINGIKLNSIFMNASPILNNSLRTIHENKITIVSIGTK